ncbi:unnamed protein product [Effrenium voratum]|nr:unnamed protein product [Effrenium voratum]
MARSGIRGFFGQRGPRREIGEPLQKSLVTTKEAEDVWWTAPQSKSKGREAQGAPKTHKVRQVFLHESDSEKVGANHCDHVRREPQDEDAGAWSTEITDTAEEPLWSRMGVSKVGDASAWLQPDIQEDTTTGSQRNAEEGEDATTWTPTLSQGTEEEAITNQRIAEADVFWSTEPASQPSSEGVRRSNPKRRAKAPTEADSAPKRKAASKAEAPRARAKDAGKARSRSVPEEGYDRAAVKLRTPVEVTLATGRAQSKPPGGKGKGLGNAERFCRPTDPQTHHAGRRQHHGTWTAFPQ